MPKKLKKLIILYLTFVGIVLLVSLIVLVRFRNMTIYETFTYCGSIVGLKEQIIIPKQENVEEWKENYKTILSKTQNLESIQEEITAIYNEVMSSKVSSIANKNFKKLGNKINEYREELSEILEMTTQCMEEYDGYLDLEDKIPQYASNTRGKLQIFMEAINEMYIGVCEENHKVDSIQDKMDELLTEAKQKADALFDRDYYILTIICYYEAGNCPDIEIAYVANVIENRIMSSRFAYATNAYVTVYAPKQYEPTWTTSMSQTSPRVQRVVEAYLRGEIETGMPQGVVFQAKFPQGEIWKHMDSGHYFCFG